MLSGWGAAGELQREAMPSTSLERVRSRDAKVFRDPAVPGEGRGIRCRLRAAAAAVRGRGRRHWRRSKRAPSAPDALPASASPPAGDYVRLSAVAVSIMDTPVYQRLRFLKQLGMTGERLCLLLACAAACAPLSAAPGMWGTSSGSAPAPAPDQQRAHGPPPAAPPNTSHRCHCCPPLALAAELVYPGACHTRFAHSLGVAHRAKVRRGWAGLEGCAGAAARGGATPQACAHAQPAAGSASACCPAALRSPWGGDAALSPLPLAPACAPLRSCLPRAAPLPSPQEFALRLHSKQPHLLLTDSDLVCLEVAGE